MVGYRARGGHEIVPIEDCVIARADLVRALPLARALAAKVRSVREIEVSIDDENRLYLRAECASARAPDASSLHEELARLGMASDLGASVYAGTLLEAARGHGTWVAAAGRTRQAVRVGTDFVVDVPVGAFTQVNADLNPALVHEVVDAASAGPVGRAVDLFCGAGNFSLPLARAGFQVVGIDADERAISAARNSAEKYGLADRTRFEVGLAEPERLAPLLSASAPDVIVLDPPRAGARASVEAIVDARPSTIVYVSCDVATFARDARQIVEAGWRFASLQLIDLTPQTYRAEVLGVFRLTWERGGPYREG